MTNEEITKIVDAVNEGMAPIVAKVCEDMEMKIRMDIQKWLVGYTEDVIRQKIEAIVEKTLEVRVRMLP